MAQTLSFTMKHPQSGETKIVTLTAEEVYAAMRDQVYDKLTEEVCPCQPVGETNVLDCCCGEYADDFERVEECLPTK